jgi:hypothetical protein
MRHILLSISMVALVGCGGSGGDNASSTIGGVAIDGYLGGAKVCVDLNMNFKCDAGEPSDITKDDGSYSIPWSDGNAAGLVVITETLPTTKDSDDLGKTFEEVGKKPFVLAAPVPEGETTDVKITPMTTMITIDALPEDTSTKRLTVSDVKSASSALNLSLGLDASKDLLKLDVTKDEAAKPIAQLVSHTMGGIQSESTNGMNFEKMKSAVVTAKNSTTDMFQDGKLPPAVITALAKPPAERVTSLNQVTEVKQAINSAALVINQGSSNFEVKQALKNGITISSFRGGGYHPLDSSKEESIGNYIRGDFLTVEYFKFDFDAKTGRDIRRVFDQSWVKDTDSSFDFYLNAKGEWVKENPMGENDFTFKGNCAIAKSSGMASSTQFCMSEKILDGLVISSLNPSYCDAKNGATPDQTLCKAAKFKTGSRGYDVTLSITDADEYSISVSRRSNDLQYHYGNRLNGSSAATSIAEFIKQLEQNKSDNVIGIWHDFAVNLKSYDGKSTGVFNWYYHPDGEYSKRKPAGEGTFEIKTVNGVEMLIFKPSAEYHKQRPGNMVGRDFVFAAKDKRIWLGEVSYKDVKQQFSLSGFSQFANKEFLESVLEGLKFINGFLPAFPFDATN